VIYSSGSTADPKGAVHSQGAPLRHACTTNQFRDFEPTTGSSRNAVLLGGRLRVLRCSPR